MNSAFKVPKKEQRTILKYLLNTPPFEYLKDCDTDDRLDHWKNCKVFYSSLYSFLKNHFRGTPLPAKEIHIEDLDVKVILSDELYQEIGLYMDYYLKLYNVLSWGWRYIAPILKEAKLRTKNPTIPKNPGEALIQVIDEFFHGLFYVYFPEKVTGNYYREYSPRKAYDLKKTEDKKVSNLKKKELESLTNREKRKIAAHEQNMQKELKLVEPFTGLVDFFVYVCLENQKEDSTLKRRLLDLKEIASKIQSNTTKRQHPRNKRQGYAISKGVLLTTTNKGGVYRTS